MIVVDINNKTVSPSKRKLLLAKFYFVSLGALSHKNIRIGLLKARNAETKLVGFQLRVVGFGLLEGRVYLSVMGTYNIQDVLVFYMQNAKSIGL